MTSISSTTVTPTLSSNRLPNKSKETITQENMATLIGLKQQQALVETAQKAFGQQEPDDSGFISPTGEVAKEAAKQHTKQTLAFTAIDALRDKKLGIDPYRPRIQTQA